MFANSTAIGLIIFAFLCVRFKTLELKTTTLKSYSRQISIHYNCRFINYNCRGIIRFDIGSNLHQTGFRSLLRVQEPRVGTIDANADRNPVIPKPIPASVHQDFGDQIAKELLDGCDHKIDSLVIDTCASKIAFKIVFKCSQYVSKTKTKQNLIFKNGPTPASFYLFLVFTNKQ